MPCVGVTIGPISETLQMAETPAALWCGSYLFSMLARTICEELEERRCTIDAPYHADLPNDGVGRYYDRIIARYEDGVLDSMQIENLLYEAKSHIAGQIADALGEPEAKERICDYLNAYFVCLNEEKEQNILAQMDPYLDALELYQHASPRQKENPLLTLFQGCTEAQNALIMKTSFIQNSKNNPDCALLTRRWIEDGKVVKENGAKHVRSMEDIATCGLGINNTTRKHQRYFALVSSDGDSLGKISRVMPDKDVKAYQKQCRNYIDEASKAIAAYGGLVAYGGGDDLLFFAPLANTDGESLFDCLHSVRKCFQEAFKDTIALLEQEPYKEKELKTPTLSFGVAIQYYKHPLAEALQDAYGLLDLVKREDRLKGKNAIALKLEKASENTIHLMIRNDCPVDKHLHEAIQSLLDQNEQTREEIDEIFHSLIYHTAEHDRMIQIAVEKKIAFDILFHNIYDADIHRTPDGDMHPYVAAVRALLAQIAVDGAGGDLLAIDAPRDRSTEGFLLESVLRIVKFFREGANER